MGFEHVNAKSIHKFAIISDIDPGAIGADKGWVDMSKTLPQLKIRNKQNDGWILVGGDVVLIQQQVADLARAVGVRVAKLDGYVVAGFETKKTSDNNDNLEDLRNFVCTLATDLGAERV